MMTMMITITATVIALVTIEIVKKIGVVMVRGIMVKVKRKQQDNCEVQFEQVVL